MAAAKPFLSPDTAVNRLRNTQTAYGTASADLIQWIFAINPVNREELQGNTCIKGISTDCLESHTKKAVWEPRMWLPHSLYVRLSYSFFSARFSGNRPRMTRGSYSSSTAPVYSW